MANPIGDFQNRDSQPGPAVQIKQIVAQAGTAAPTVTTTLNNTSGATLTWARTSAGLYTLTASTATFTAGKTFVKLSWGGTATTGLVAVTSTTVLTFTFADSATPSAADLAGTLFLEVEVYPS